MYTGDQWLLFLDTMLKSPQIAPAHLEPYYDIGYKSEKIGRECKEWYFDPSILI